MEENCDMGLANDYLEMTPNRGNESKTRQDTGQNQTRYLVYMIIYDYIYHI